MSQKPNNFVFITGACGFVGGFLVKKLLRETDFKLILNCRSNKIEEEENKRILYTSVDLQNKNEMHSMFLQHKPDRIIHLAAMARLGEGEKFPDEAFRTNVLATNNLILLAAKYDVITLLYISSDLARPPVSVVGITKYLTEAAIQNIFFQNINLITLRLPNVSFSPGSVHLIFERQIREGKPLTITHPAMTRRFISGEEAADFILYALTFGKNKD
ncbi:MAG TPA: polysaccharide biosynthesis protein, partial [Bacteroidales bacterium]